MNCHICRKTDPHVTVILPLRQPDGKLDTLACEECAKKSKAYCKKHQRPHQGFMDGSTACIWCIEEMVKAEEANAISIRDRLRAKLPPEQMDDLDEAAEMRSEVMDCSESVAILRLIASKAKRTNQTIEEVIYQVTESGHYDVDYIIWK